MTDLIERTLHTLGRELPGSVSRPGSDRYAAATAIWAKPTGRMPRAVVHCTTTEQVRATIRAARERGIPLSVRGGGHDWAGRALCEGIVIDLSEMRGVLIDPEDLTAHIAGGARASDVVTIADPLGLALVTGSVGSVGMAGFTLGGGYGSLIGRFGLALDNLISADVVLADGRLVTASHDSEPDLFWALRGGGGNFGVVTAMRHRLHEVPRIRSGLIFYPFSEAEQVLARCADIAAVAPDELSVQILLAVGPEGGPVVVVAPTWSGAPRDGEAQLAPFHSLGTLLVSTVQETSYGISLKAFDGQIVDGRRAFMETCWVPTLDNRCTSVFIEAMGKAVSPGCAIITHEFKGAASRVPVEATAFGLRRDHVLVEILATCDGRADKAEQGRHQQWARDTLRAFDGTALPGGYPNILARGEYERAVHSYGPNAKRLIQVKRRYDPDNVFSSAIPLPASWDDGRTALVSALL
jgi:FAD/FMN-containing dehydrogenase